MSVRSESICPRAVGPSFKLATVHAFKLATVHAFKLATVHAFKLATVHPFKLARTYPVKYHGLTMGSARSSFPVRVGTMLTAALPALEERLLAERIRQGWRTAVGSELAHRTRPGELRAGTLTVMADNSPWLQELSMRSAEVLDAVRARFGPTVTALRPSLAGPAPAPERGAPRRAAPAAPLRLDADELAIVEGAAAPGRGPRGHPARPRRDRRLRHHADERGRAHARPEDHHDRPARPPGGRRPGRGLRPLCDRADGGPRRPDAAGHRPAPRGHQVRSQHRAPLDPALPVADPGQRHRGRLHRRAKGHRARAQQRGRPHDAGRPLQAPAQDGGSGSRAGAGGGARPADARRLSGPGPAPLRAEELREGARGAGPAGNRAPQSLAGLLPAGAHRHRERAVGRGPDQSQARGGPRPGPRRGVVRP